MQRECDGGDLTDSDVLGVGLSERSAGFGARSVSWLSAAGDVLRIGILEPQLRASASTIWWTPPRDWGGNSDVMHAIGSWI
jgi:hypothetical protein